MIIVLFPTIGAVFHSVLETLGKGVARRTGCPFALSPVPGKVLAGAVVLLKVRLAEIWATWFTGPDSLRAGFDPGRVVRAVADLEQDQNSESYQNTLPESLRAHTL